MIMDLGSKLNGFDVILIFFSCFVHDGNTEPLQHTHEGHRGGFTI